MQCFFSAIGQYGGAAPKVLAVGQLQTVAAVRTVLYSERYSVRALMAVSMSASEV